MEAAAIPLRQEAAANDDVTPFMWLTGITDARCPYCGGDAELELFDLWGREFQISACCQFVHELAVDCLNEGDRVSAELLRRLEVHAYSGHPVRRAIDDGCGLLLIDFSPQLCAVCPKDAKAFINEHHAHVKAPPGWKFCLGLRNGGDLIAVAIVGRPVARMIDHTTVLEVTRLCVRRDVPPGLVWNACSMLYAAAAKEAKKRGYRQLITYTLQSEAAGSLKASGWTWDGAAGGGRWSRNARPRSDAGPLERKNRWVKYLQKQGQAPQGSLFALAA